MNLTEIQKALREEGLDGWLFFDHHHRDPLAYRVLKLRPEREPTRRWYYFIPAVGEPRGLVHRIEPRMLDALPGAKLPYAGWEQQLQGLRTLLEGCSRVAMQYSPRCAVPYVSMVDGGTIDLVRELGAEVCSSANLIQVFEARWNQAQLDAHLKAAAIVDEIRREAFAEIGRRLRNAEPGSEWDIKEFILKAFANQGLVTDHGPIVAVNENSADPHYEPSRERNRDIRANDWVLIDLWAKVDAPEGVYYDVTWTGYCGSAVPDRMAKVFGIVTRARDLAVEFVQQAVASGQPPCGYEVDDVARGHIREQGYGSQFVHRTGHSIGREVHGAGANMDNLETHDERRIIPWSCFSVEPGIYADGFGVRSEVDVFVDETRAFVTGEVQREPVVIAV